ncbi:MAG: hypothetical protein J0I84_09140 [Terrimonas sp.]|nr:hypothetical protein [Terrimonas sp.]OJY94839.1 MAG: hypothetical protein BGP13_14315 [Sphingobacteriales bacterium 40-81]
MNRLQTEFKPSENLQDCISLYVNGHKTNVYYFTRPMIFCDEKQQQRDAIKAQRFIEEGKVFPPGGNWAGFDLCASCLFTIRELIQLKRPGAWSNAILTLQTPYFIPHEQHETIIRQWIGKTEQTQFTKRIVGDEISNAAGIYIDNYGYTLYFI